MTRRSSILLVLAIGLLWLLLDQSTKYLAVADLTRLFPPDAAFGERVSLFLETRDLRHLARPPVQIAPLWEHLYVQNPSGAFGLLSGLPTGPRIAVLATVALLASLGLLWMAGRQTGGGWRLMLTRVGLALVLGGALGNLFDRIVHGYVIDFIHWHTDSFSWPPFNIADVGIVVGVFALLILLRNEETSPGKEKEQAPKAPKVPKAPRRRRAGRAAS